MASVCRPISAWQKKWSWRPASPSFEYYWNEPLKWLITGQAVCWGLLNPPSAPGVCWGSQGVAVLLVRGGVGLGGSWTAGMQYVRGPMSALSVESDGKEEGGGLHGSYENCSMLKLSDCNTAQLTSPNHALSVTMTLSFPLFLTVTFTKHFHIYKSRGFKAPQAAHRWTLLRFAGADNKYRNSSLNPHMSFD